MKRCSQTTLLLCSKLALLIPLSFGYTLLCFVGCTSFKLDFTTSTCDWLSFYQDGWVEYSAWKAASMPWHGLVMIPSSSALQVAIELGAWKG
jgi:L-cystine uptake protein TcyP (sodium:dicarboxylate symporter family)